MGKAKQPTSRDNSAKSSRRKSQATIVSPEDVNEASLQVWRTLPTKIRQDPSLAPYQLEHERVNGNGKPLNLDAYPNGE